MDSSIKDMKPVAADEMFPEGGFIDLEDSGTAAVMLMDIATNDKQVHADFYNDFGDLFDDSEVTLPMNGNK
ncbi:COP9 signalosome complex subunit 9 [Teleopsis dalmanni]|uniref:COP9 signalosome complex subunit 9 n=1 Tax=Teleopsis dalmanni TaxID=139649 RepID=UPI0018CD6D38|nr:COP9 signalosome complex subunit 9 [Teleopsis dalmanni]